MSTTADQTQQSAGDSFARRHIGTLGPATEHMLDAIGVESLEDLLARAVPSTILEAPGSFSLPEPLSEAETLAELRAIAERNPQRATLIGQGYYGTHTPSVIQRNVLENPSWYTSYTPYQPEISQGRLEALLNFQTAVADLTGTHAANASMLDESTAAAEGMLLAKRASKAKTDRFLIDRDLFRQTRAVVQGRADALGIQLVEIDAADAESVTAATAEGAFGLLVQYPAASGRIVDPQAAIDAIHEVGGLAVVAADLLALTLLTPPGELGADVVVGSAQRLGVPMGFGGPHAGYMGVRAKLERQTPGRLIGVSQDANGAPAYRMTLQTREQHIRRERATSNIGTAQVLLAVMAAMYAVYHGPDGLREIAWRVHTRATDLAARLEDAGLDLTDGPVFDTLELHVPGRAVEIARSAQAAGYLLWVEDEDRLRVSVDETTTDDQVRALADELATVATAAPGETHASGLHAAGSGGAAAGTSAADLPDPLRRTSEFLTHPVFHSYRSETQMMRYLKRLADKDYTLDRGMIPLGSCTMKLNAATEMAAITWPGFAAPHPFAPREEVDGYRLLIRSLEELLVEISGYDTVSLQPNAGSQGEYAGLLAIRAYHDSRGETDRRICLVPSSAHGSNPASAALAGLQVVVVASDRFGNVDLEDLQQKLKDHGDELAALMITYPSTHGVYEAEVRTICSLVHDAGGQVYIDGANLNALVEVARPGDFGGDVSHLNLHKTFCIPHGGGGPGVGPVAAKEHLAPFLPGHPLAQSDEHALAGGGTVAHGGAPVSAAPYGSPSILPISWAYLRMMGSEGLRAATAGAVLAANYLAKRLENAYEILYRGETGMVAHEVILDLRPLTAATGITVDDVAKRLIDYGFHAPTMSFPVAGTLMVEPTESEDLAEIDRFCDAMLGIRAEADRVAAGEWPADDNPLVGAPHTAATIAADDWDHPYSREVAVYPGALAARAAGHNADPAQESGAAHRLPAAELIASKYWVPVSRVDNAYGDRNPVFSAPPPEAFEEV